MIKEPKDIRFGATICDMHDGLDLPDFLLVKNRFTARIIAGTQLIETALGGNYRYTNKHLVFLGDTVEGDLLAVCSNDNLTISFFELELVR